MPHTPQQHLTIQHMQDKRTPFLNSGHIFSSHGSFLEEQEESKIVYFLHLTAE
jgi:hypothetical protein